MRKVIINVEACKNVGNRKLGCVSSERLAGRTGNGPFLAGTILGAVKHHVAIDHVVVKPVKVFLEAHDHIPRQPCLIVGGWPMQKGVFVVFAKPLPQPIEALASRSRGCAADWPHSTEVKGEKPDLCAVNSLLNFHTRILDEDLGVWCDVTPFGYCLQTHVRHAYAMHKCFDVPLSPLHSRALAEGEQ